MTDAAVSSVWRTALAKFVAVWLVLASLVVAGAVPLYELLGTLAVIPWNVVFVGPILLLIWSVVLVVRAPRRRWPAPLLVLAAAALAVAGAEPASGLGLRMNFLRHRGAYDRIVAEAQAARLVGRTSPQGAISGTRFGHEFVAGPGPQGFVQFS